MFRCPAHHWESGETYQNRTTPNRRNSRYRCPYCESGESYQNRTTACTKSNADGENSQVFPGATPQVEMVDASLDVLRVKTVSSHADFSYSFIFVYLIFNIFSVSAPRLRIAATSSDDPRDQKDLVALQFSSRFWHWRICRLVCNGGPSFCTSKN